MSGKTMRQKANKTAVNDLSKEIASVAADLSDLTDDVDNLPVVVAKNTIIVTPAEMLALNTTPITLAGAPWVWKFINVLSITGTVDYATTAYDTNTTLEFRYTDGSGTKVTADMAALITATADKAVTVKGIEAALVLTENAPLVVTAATGNPTDGDSPVTFSVVYEVVDL